MRHEASDALLERMGHRLHLTDGGLETTMIFHDGLDLPQFAAFPLLEDARGRAALRRYFGGFLALADDLGMGFVLDTVTWRASHGWGAALGLTPEQTDRANREAVAFAESLRDAADTDEDILISGALGPYGDGYAPDRLLSADEAYDYHHRQIAVLADAGVDLVTALTLPGPGEAIGIALAAAEAGVPVALSFTVETDGRLPGGVTLAEAVAACDAATTHAPLWYGVNCAHPDHFAAHLPQTGDRIGLLRANASRLSHAELDACETLDDGDPAQLAEAYAALMRRMPGLRVLGGCCGTDLRHLAAIGHRCLR